MTPFGRNSKLFEGKRCNRRGGRTRVLAQRGKAARDSIARRRVGLALALVGLPVLAGCKVVPLAVDRAARERLAGAFDAGRYVDALWDAQAAP